MTNATGSGILLQSKGGRVTTSDTVFARDLASRAHANQTYGNGIPYFRHLAEVATIVTENTDDPDIIAAAWLHDIGEDVTSGDGRRVFTFDVLSLLFNVRIASMVEALTDPVGFDNRTARKAAGMGKLLEGGPDVILVKLADRIANTASSSILRKSRLYDMYVKEYPAFRAALYPASEGRFDRLWRHLDTLSGVRLLAGAPS